MKVFLYVSLLINITAMSPSFAQSSENLNHSVEVSDPTLQDRISSFIEKYDEEILGGLFLFTPGSSSATTAATISYLVAGAI